MIHTRESDLAVSALTALINTHRQAVCMREIQLSPRPAEMACLGATEVQWLDCYQPAPVGKAEGSIKVSF